MCDSKVPVAHTLVGRKRSFSLSGIFDSVFNKKKTKSIVEEEHRKKEIRKNRE